MKKGTHNIRQKRARSRRATGKSVVPHETADEQARLLHDLHVHQVELETQNLELRNTQRLLEISRDRFADLYDFAPVGYFTCDLRSIICEINLTAAGMLGFERSRLLGLPFHSFVMKDDLARYRDHVGALKNSAAASTVELRLKPKSGPAIHARLTSSRSPGSEPEPESIRTVFIDITATRIAEQALRDSETRLAAILDTVVEGIITVDDRGTIGLFNQGAEKLFGYAAREAIGRNIGILMPSPFREDHERSLDDYRRSRQWTDGGQSELLGLRRDGTTFPMERSISHLMLGGRGLFTECFRDITHRRRLETQLLEIVDSEQRRIGSDLHDGLGQQLTALELNCCLLMDELDVSDLNAKAEMILDRLKHIGDGLRECVATTQTLARGLAPANLHTNGLAGALKLLAKSARVPGKIETRFVGRRPPSHLRPLTEKHLYRIAQEAVNNALKHSGMRSLEISLSCSKNTLRLSIADDGRGLVRSNRSGSGIGLDVMEHRAKLIGAVLEIESKQGQGTKVVCTLEPGP